MGTTLPPLSAFLSSRQVELAEYRAAAARAVARLGPIVEIWKFEDQPAAAITPESIYLAGLEQCDVVLFIAGSEASEATFNEIVHANHLRKDILAFTLPAASRDARVADLINRVRERATSVAASLDVTAFEHEVHDALNAWIIRRVQQQSSPQRTENLRMRRGEGRALTLQRMRAAGLDDDIANSLIDDAFQNPIDASLDANADHRLVIIVGAGGAGKSFVAARTHDRACEAAIASVLAPTPIYIRAQDVETPLRRFIEISMEGIGDLEVTGAHVIIDGLDELDERRAERIMEESAALVESFPRLSILAASRHLPPSHLSDFQVELRPLDSEQQQALISRVSRGSVDPRLLLDGISQSVREAVSRPLFAIALALGSTSGNVALRRPSDLVAYLIDKGLSRTERVGITANQLQDLAVKVLDSQNGLVSGADVPLEAHIPLLSTRLVYERDGKFGIALRLIAEFAASLALKRGSVASASARVDSVRLSDHWRGAWQLYLGDLDDAAAWEFINTIAAKDPGLARDLFLNDRTEKSAAWQSLEFATTLRASMAAIAAAIPRLTPSRPDGTLPTTRAAVDPSWIHSGWKDDPSRADVIIETPPSMMTPIWDMQQSRRYEADRFAAHKIAADDVARIIEAFIADRALSVNFEPAAAEEDWLSASALLQRSRRDHSPIPLDALLRRLESSAPGRSILVTHYIHPANMTPENMRRFPVVDRERLMMRIERLRAAGKNEWSPDFPGQDEPLSGYVWTGYSDLGLARLRSYVLRNAMDLYMLIVDQWLGALSRRLVRRQLMPAIITERLWRVERGEPLGSRFWSPLPYGSQNLADVQFGSTFDWRETDRITSAAISELRPESGASLYSLSSEGIVQCFGDYSIRDTAYRWLVRDLNSIAWLRAFSLADDRA